MADASPFDGATLSLDPDDCEPRQVYKLMTGIIVPRPVALVSTLDRHGVANLAPFSFFSGVGSNPPTVMFCPVLRRARPGDLRTARQPRKTPCATSKTPANSW